MRIDAVVAVGPAPTYIERTKNLDGLASDRAARLAETQAAVKKKYEENDAKGKGAFKLVSHSSY
jgi:hypothetical protein